MGLDPDYPVKVEQPDVGLDLDLRCGPAHVHFPCPVPNDVFIDHAGDPFDVAIQPGGQSKSGA